MCIDAPSHIRQAASSLRIMYTDRALRTTGGQSTHYSTDITFHSFPTHCRSLRYPTTSQSSSIFHQLPISLLHRFSTALPSLLRTALNPFSVQADRLTTLSVQLFDKGGTTRSTFHSKNSRRYQRRNFFPERHTSLPTGSGLSPGVLRPVDLSRENITEKVFVLLVPAEYFDYLGVR